MGSKKQKEKRRDMTFPDMKEKTMVNRHRETVVRRLPISSVCLVHSF